MVKVHAVQTGRVKVKKAQLLERGGNLARFYRIFFTNDWSDWLPIYCWAIEHPEGILLVDTGETARTREPGYFSHHPAIRLSASFDVQPEDEVNVQLAHLGIDPAQVKTIVLTHLHTDHAGSLHHFSRSKILVGRPEYLAASGPMGKALGYLPHRWPEWFKPDLIEFTDGPIGPFPQSARIAQDGSIVAVPIPGHSPGHLGVIVKSDKLNYFLAGDASYNRDTVVSGIPSVILGNQEAIHSVENIRQFARENPTIFLSSHDPEVKTLVDRQSVVFDS